MLINRYDEMRLKKQFPNVEFKPIVNGYEIGKTYFIGYWHTFFTVLDIKENPVWNKTYICKWEDGHVNSHSTDHDKKWDFEIIFNN